jgi:imidazolonepropionase-like amidohydrolase
MVDVITGRSLPNAIVLVRDGRIVALGSAVDFDIPRGATVTDLRGRWLIPGLIDAHAHLQPWGLATSLKYGVTAVRDLHDGFPLADTLRRVASQGPAPHLYLAGAMLDAPPTTYPDAVPVASVEDVQGAVQRVAASGATWLKTYTRITPTLLESIVAEARTRQLPVAAHLGLTDALTAARLGVATIEHLSGVPEAAGDSAALFLAHRAGLFPGWTAFERSWTHRDTLALAAVAQALAARGVVLVPTLVLHDTYSRLDDPATTHSADLASVPDSARANWNLKGMTRRAGWTRKDYPVFRAARGRQDYFVRTFVGAGGRVAAGSDASNQLLVPGAAIHTEMELLVHAGLSPLDALRSATLWSADMLHADSLGRLRAGATADLVVLGANPLADIRNSRAIQRVMLGGKWLDR